MRITPKSKTWEDNWNDILRDVIFPDTKLLDLLMVPAADRGDIRKFIDKYFVEDVLSDAPVTDEKVRVLYYTGEGMKLNDHHVNKRYLEFDIYARNTELYSADHDRLRHRGKQIGQRIKELLTGRRYVCNMRYTYEGDYSLGTKVIGYRRWHFVFSYKTTH